MLKIKFARQVLALLVSATMAFPTAAWAKPNAVSVGGDATDGIPVIFQQIPLPNGTSAYVAIAPVPAVSEVQVFNAIAQSSPKTTVLGISGPDDPVLKAALASGNSAWINTFVLDTVENSPLAQSAQISARVRSNLINGVNRLTQYITSKENRAGLIATIYVPTLYTTFTILETSSVASGLKVMTAALALIGFQTCFSHYWEKVLSTSGELVKNVAEASLGLLGHQLSDAQKKMYENVGSFGVAWAANWGMVTWIFTNTGSFEGILDAIIAGFANAHDIYDKNVSNRVGRGMLNARYFAICVTVRILVGTVFEVMSFGHVPGVRIMLIGLTTIGLLWPMFGTDFEDRFIKHASRVVVRLNEVRRTVAGVAVAVPRRTCEGIFVQIRRRFTPHTPGGSL